MTFDWDRIGLVVFDVDGTLYDQRALRYRMVPDLLIDAVRLRSLETLRVIKAYRQLREQLAEAEAEQFESQLLAATAASTGVPAPKIAAIVAEWMETRPLAYLRSCRYPGLDTLFAGLKQSGKVIGILSDYPAHAKLGALGLAADHVVSAPEARVGRLKPHPKGLQVLMEDAGFGAAQTLLIGDRVERDGYAAERAGAASLIRSASAQAGWHTFARFNEALFAPVLPAPA